MPKTAIHRFLIQSSGLPTSICHSLRLLSESDWSCEGDGRSGLRSNFIRRHSTLTPSRISGSARDAPRSASMFKGHFAFDLHFGIPNRTRLARNSISSTLVWVSPQIFGKDGNVYKHTIVRPFPSHIPSINAQSSSPITPPNLPFSQITSSLFDISPA